MGARAGLVGGVLVETVGHGASRGLNGSLSCRGLDGLEVEFAGGIRPHQAGDFGFGRGRELLLAGNNSWIEPRDIAGVPQAGVAKLLADPDEFAGEAAESLVLCDL